MLIQDNLIFLVADGQRSPRPQQTSFRLGRKIPEISPALRRTVFGSLMTPVMVAAPGSPGLAKPNQAHEIRRLQDQPNLRPINTNRMGSICLG